MKLFTTNDVADQIQIHETRVRRLAVKYKIGTKLGGTWLFDKNDVERLKTHSTGKSGRPLSERTKAKMAASKST